MLLSLQVRFLWIARQGKLPLLCTSQRCVRMTSEAHLNVKYRPKITLITFSLNFEMSSWNRDVLLSQDHDPCLAFRQWQTADSYTPAVSTCKLDLAYWWSECSNAVDIGVVSVGPQYDVQTYDFRYDPWEASDDVTADHRCLSSVSYSRTLGTWIMYIRHTT